MSPLIVGEDDDNVLAHKWLLRLAIYSGSATIPPLDRLVRLVFGQMGVALINSAITSTASSQVKRRFSPTDHAPTTSRSRESISGDGTGSAKIPHLQTNFARRRIRFTCKSRMLKVTAREHIPAPFLVFCGMAVARAEWVTGAEIKMSWSSFTGKSFPHSDFSLPAIIVPLRWAPSVFNEDWTH